MRFLDLLGMSVSNLKRRKMRTFLTVLGVIIGTASVVIMVSLGIGLNGLMLEQYSSYGDMTAVTIYKSYYGNDVTEDDFITDETLEEFKRLDHVKSVTPMLSTSVILKQGAYYTDASVYGVSRDYLEKIPLAEGELAPEGDTELKFYYGNQLLTRFYNEKTGDGYWNWDYNTGERTVNEKFDVDFVNRAMFTVFDTNAYWQSQWDNTVKPPKKYTIKTGGVEEYSDYSYDVYCDVDLLKEQLKMIYKKSAIPGQPTNSKGKPYPYFVYNRVIVYADDMNHVVDLQNTLTEMGYQASSQMQWVEQAQQTYQIVQLVLGGIGAVSLFVAAIGIANTMMMSIYERTKEIGVIKVLGCDMRNIQGMFLMESGFIGFMGGVAGLGISYGVGYAMNHFLNLGKMMMGQAGDISRIPIWLAGFSILFAILVGMAAGFFPSLRAMHLSPLAAIRNE